MILDKKSAEHLRWKRSGIVLERKEYDHYEVRMDGLGRTMLPSRKFCKQIEPLHSRDYSRDNGEESNGEHVRQSSRDRSKPDGYQADG